MNESQKINEFETFIEDLKEFALKSLPNYFEKIKKQNFIEKNSIENENKPVFVKPNQIVLGAVFEILNWTDLIEKELRSK